MADVLIRGKLVNDEQLYQESVRSVHADVLISGKLVNAEHWDHVP